MEHTMNSVNKIFEGAAATFGVDPANIHYEDKPPAGLQPSSICVFDIDTKNERTALFHSRLEDGRYERAVTILQVDIFADTKRDARRIRDAIKAYFDGPNKAGKTFPRKDWTDPQNPVEAGSMKFIWQEDVPFDLDGGVKVISMTYHLEWEKPF